MGYIPKIPLFWPLARDIAHTPPWPPLALGVAKYPYFDPSLVCGPSYGGILGVSGPPGRGHPPPGPLPLARGGSAGTSRYICPPDQGVHPRGALEGLPARLLAHVRQIMTRGPRASVGPPDLPLDPLRRGLPLGWI